MKGRLLPRKMRILRLRFQTKMLVCSSGCSECQSLAPQAFAVLGEGGSDYVRCDQVNYLLSLMVNLKDEVERLRSIKECEREINCWYQTLSAPRSRQPDEALHGVSHHCRLANR